MKVFATLTEAASSPLLWKAVDPSETIELAEPWPWLMKTGFSPILHERVRRFAIVARSYGIEAHFNDALHHVGEGYLPRNEFRRNEFAELIATIEDAEVRRLVSGVLDAMEACSLQFMGQMTSLLWRTIASLASRPEPTVEKSILDVQNYLPYPWYIADSAIHALGKSYGLFLHVESVINQKSGSVLIHGCGCDHNVPKLSGAHIKFSLPKESFGKVAREWLDHFLSELMLMIMLGMPFALNGTETSKRILAFKSA